MRPERWLSGEARVLKASQGEEEDGGKEGRKVA